MTYRQRILADRILAMPVAFAFNALARILGQVLHRQHALAPAKVGRIIVSKLVGMGSAIEATPLLKSLKQHFPNARITFLTLRSNRDLVERMAGVDEVVCLDDRSALRLVFSTFRTIIALIRQRADFYFDLELYSAFASLLALWAVTRNRVGFYRHSTRFKDGIYTHLIYFNTRMSIRHLYLQLGRSVGVPPVRDDVIGPIRVDEADRQALQAKLRTMPEFKANEPYLVINPNASELLLERRWPAAYVVEAVQRLVEMGHQLVFIGSRSELPYVRGLHEKLPPEIRSRAINTAGKLTVNELLAFLEGAKCVLTSDTGPMHMAIALRRPTVCLFGPVNPEHYGHDQENVIVLYAPVFCSPCVHEIDQPPCNGNNVCMQRLTPEMVVGAVQSVMGGATKQRLLKLPLLRDDFEGVPLGFVVRASIGQGSRRN
jgi:ADP-heptose:LPS heptosyltransferase